MLIVARAVFTDMDMLATRLLGCVGDIAVVIHHFPNNIVDDIVNNQHCQHYCHQFGGHLAFYLQYSRT